MHKMLCALILLFFIFNITINEAQIVGSKPKKSLLKGGATLQIQNKSFLSIPNNFKNFAKKVGFTSGSHKPSSVSASLNFLVQPGFNTILNLPAINSQSGRTIKSVLWNNESRTPRFIEVQSSTLKKNAGVQTITQLESTARDFLYENKTLLKINDPQNEFSLESSSKDALVMTHLKFNQVYNGIVVWAKEVIIHLDAQGDVVSLNGSFEPTPVSVTDLNGRITQSAAINSAVSHLQAKDGIKELSPQLQKLFGYYGPIAKRIIWYDQNNSPHLAWNVEVRSGLTQDWLYFIDANSGAVLNRYNTVCYDGAKSATATDLNGVSRTFGTYQVGSTYYLIDASQPMYDAVNSKMPENPLGAIVTLDLRNKDYTAGSQIYYVLSNNNQWSDATSVSAHFNALETYKYYLNTYNRKSIDDKNMTINSISHVTENGASMENAFWNQTVMCYGDGGTYFKPLAGGLDVAAHEMTHGVTQYTANLVYQNQSGALNESWSDVFGALVDSTNWTIGEQIIKDYASFPSGTLRDMANPHNGSMQGSGSWQPAKMSEYVQKSNDENGDYGGVHLNSGIPNHAFYLVATSIGRHKAGQIWYRALIAYLTRTSQFVDARIATEKAASDLYGASSNELTAVKNAWDGVEVFEGNATPPPPPTQITGDQWVLMTATNKGALYMAKTVITSNSDIYLLSNTSVGNRPAVTDASGIILFVDSNHRLKALNANPQNPNEQYIDTSSVWGSVAAGPGLSSIALTSIYQDTTIYYFDFVNNISKRYKIVSQTFDGQNTKTALYADELSFDPTGRYLLFDTYNEVKKSDGSKLSYWNINLLDIQQNSIQSVFPPQSAGIDVGNPSYSKTSIYRFTFDYLNSNNDNDYVMAADFNTNNVAVVAGPFASNNYTILGYPTYSGDDRTIAYHTTQLSSGNTVEAIQQIPLKDDMIEPNGTSIPYIINATFPCWFVIGTRTDVPTKQDEIPTAFYLAQNYPNPFNPTTKIRFSVPQRSQIRLKVFDVLGRNVSVLADGVYESGKYEVEFNASSLPSGVYFYNLTNGSNSITKKMLLIK